MCLNCWCERGLHISKSTTSLRSKPCLCNMCVVLYQSSLNSLSDKLLFPLWLSVFLASLRSFTNDLYFSLNSFSMTLVNNVRSNSPQSVVPVDGHRIFCCCIYCIFDFKGSKILNNCVPSVGSFSCLKSTSWHRCLPPKSIRVINRSQLRCSLFILSSAEAILHLVSFAETMKAKALCISMYIYVYSTLITSKSCIYIRKNQTLHFDHTKLRFAELRRCFI